MIDYKLTRHRLNEACADMMTYYIPDWLVILAGSEAYDEMNKAGWIIDGKYDMIAVELSPDIEPDMIYVASKG